MIDFGGLRSTTVNPAAHTVRVDAGCTWGDIDHATGAFGMATPSGFIASTGVGGQTVGGGLGYLSRRFGLSIDNLLSADVVLADGSFVTASHDSHPDLFRALRGGGGNFGVVTSFTFACHEIGEKGRSLPAQCSTTSPTPRQSSAGIASCCPRCRRSSAAGSESWSFHQRLPSPRSCGDARHAASCGATPGTRQGRRGSGCGA